MDIAWLVLLALAGTALTSAAVLFAASRMGIVPAVLIALAGAGLLAVGIGALNRPAGKEELFALAESIERVHQDDYKIHRRYRDRPALIRPFRDRVHELDLIRLQIVPSSSGETLVIALSNERARAGVVLHEGRRVREFSEE